MNSSLPSHSSTESADLVAHIIANLEPKIFSEFANISRLEQIPRAVNKDDASTKSKLKRQNLAHGTIDSFETRHAPSSQIHVSSNPETRLSLYLQFLLEISSAFRWFYLGWFSFLSFLFSFFLFPTRIDTTILSQLRAL